MTPGEEVLIESEPPLPEGHVVSQVSAVRQSSSVKIRSQARDDVPSSHVLSVSGKIVRSMRKLFVGAPNKEESGAVVIITPPPRLTRSKAILAKSESILISRIEP